MPNDLQLHGRVSEGHSGDPGDRRGQAGPPPRHTVKRSRQLRRLWQVCVVSVVGVGALSWWTQAQWSRAETAAGANQFLTTVFLAAAVVDVAVALCVFWVNWQPLCERSLKLVWAGRLVSVEQGQTIARQLSARGAAIMALLASPAAYAVGVAALGPVPPALPGALVGASLLGLALFYWQGLQPAADIFQHVERILRP